MIVLVTDPRYSPDHLVTYVREARAVIGDDALVVQFRDKASAPAEREATFARIQKMGARVVLNGTPEDAARLGAYGVHLPGPSPDLERARDVLGEDAWISIAAHDDAAVERAATLGATAALVSPIFDTPGKGSARGVEALRRAKALARGRTQIVALGGIDSRRAASCRSAGADGFAVIRAIFDAPDPARVALELLRLVRPLRP